MRSHALSLALSLTILPLTGSLTAQHILTSPSRVLVSPSVSSGGTTSSSKHQLVGTLGDGVVAGRTTSTNFVLEGGFNASIGVSVAGAPMLATVLPRYATLRGQGTLTLHGTQLGLGTVSKLAIGGQTATVVTRAQDKITTKLPIQPVPGWQPVEFETSSGKTVLAKGIGLLPLIETRPAAASDVPFKLVFKGTQGDGVHWAMGIGKSTPIVLPGIHYGFALNPAFFMVFSGFGIAAPNGELALPFPATTYPTGTIYVQGMLSTTNPGYGPAAFTNVLRL